VSQLKGSVALVTDASGFLGEHLCRRLIEQGSEVHGVQRQRSERLPDEVTQWTCDAGDFDQLRQVWQEIKPETTFHLASMVTGSRDREIVLPSFRSNLESAINVYLLSSEYKCRRVVAVGSMEEPIAMHDEIPGSPYAAAKGAATSYGRMFHALYGLPVVHLRVFMVYGPAQRDTRKVIPYVIRAFLDGEAPKLSSGERRIDWIYIDDVIDAFVCAATATGLEGSVSDVGSGAAHSIRDVVVRIGNLVEATVEPLFGALPERPLERPRTADLQAARANLNWVPATSLDDGLRRTVDWYRTADRFPGAGAARH
jgi:UDP-glucose 4-epimerase